MQKLYCYVDETGQHTKGKLFFVSLVIFDHDLQDLRQKLRKIERRTGKGYLKWTKATVKQRAAYLSEIFALEAFQHTSFFLKFENTTDFLNCTIEVIVKGLQKKVHGRYKASVFIDALNKHDRQKVAVQLRKRHVYLEKFVVLMMKKTNLFG